MSSSVAIWKIADIVLAAMEFGFNRSDIVKVVRETEATGASHREIALAVAQMANTDEDEAQAAIDAE